MPKPQVLWSAESKPMKKKKPKCPVCKKALVKHGTVTKYRYGCKCSKCKKAISKDKKAYYKKKVGHA